MFLQELHAMGYLTEASAEGAVASYGYLWSNLRLDYYMIIAIGAGFRFLCLVALYACDREKTM